MIEIMEFVICLYTALSVTISAGQTIEQVSYDVGKVIVENQEHPVQEFTYKEGVEAFLEKNDD